MIGNLPRCADSSSYRPTVLCGGWNRGSRTTTWRYGPFPWYTLWSVAAGTAVVPTPGRLRQRIVGPAAILLQPCGTLELPASARAQWLEFDVLIRPLVLRRGGRGQRPAGIEPAPDARAVWGVELPLVLPAALAEAARRCLALAGGQWWRGPLGAARADAAVALWLAELAQQVASSPASPPPTSVITATPSWLHEAIAVAQDGLAKGLTVAQWAQRLGVTRQHFTRRFRALSGAAPATWLASERRDLAVALLSGTSEPVRVVAARCGFASPTVFARFCRRHTGLLPGTLRRRRKPPAGAKT